MKLKILLLVLISIISYSLARAQNVNDYLILENIGQYKLSQPEKLIPGFAPVGGPRAYKGAGVIARASHFSPDHVDLTCEIMYLGGDLNASPTVFVTIHSDSDSDKWLLHELDREFRNYYGIPGKSFGPRQINGQTIIENLVAGGSYRWLSGNKVIVIEYHDSQMTKPEPIEVIEAYLAKHPSTMPSFTLEDLRRTASKTTWIKDEMDRRLWLCDKWFYQLQLGKVQQKEVFEQAVKSMNVFLDYREKYYGQKAADEKNLLAGYLASNNGTGIKAKLDEYKKWWAVNKEKGISL